MSNAFQTQMSVGSGTQIDNSKKTSITSETNASGGGSIGVSIFSAGFNFSQDSSFDHSTETGVGLGTSSSTGTSSSQTIAWTLCNGVCPPSSTPLNTTPGTSGSYKTEPFWQDEIDVLVHPQLGIWDFGGTPTVQLVAAQPSLARLTVFNLDACAKGVSNAINQDPVLTATHETLTAQECLSLAQLDPFYSLGQSRSFASNAQNPDADARFHFITQAEYWPTHSYSLSQITQVSVQQTHNQAASYEASVEDVTSNKWSENITLGTGSNTATAGVLNLGLSASVTLTQGNSTTTSSKMTISYQQSNETTTQTTTTIQGLLNDDHSSLSPMPASANIFFDKTFGGYLFQDPAACGTSPLCGAKIATSSAANPVTTATGLLQTNAATGAPAPAPSSGTPAIAVPTGSTAPLVAPKVP
jgi:hypothetical protein